ncbi:MAG: radical SAM protein [Bacteroidales bacterium]|nr:radical SAM protein [Bacteroidales bacterium]MCK9498978.1 radical SAM protein [Bacteroidales bacterium]MDY0313559.1 radical SAM protein [Bacteroidales bacterium]NLB86941.1 radical SAM protein [Bacteroidales bacterium]NLB87046.1 radical SAM protein [Bacteroidales bacterium]
MSKLTIINYLSLAKIVNYLKLYFIYLKLKFFANKHKFKKLSQPSFLSFEPTNFCNLKCPLCPSGSGKLTRKKGFMDFEMYKNIIDDNKRYLTNILLHFQGEALLHKQIAEMIEYAKLNKIFTELSTNANLLPMNFDSLKNNMPDKLIVSLDGLNQETYNKYRQNGDLQKVLESLELLSHLPKNKRPFVELQFLVFSHNEAQIPELKALKSKYKIDKIKLKTAQIYNNSDIDILPKNEKYSRYKIINLEFFLKSKLKNSCKRIIFGSVITWDGKLLPCCFDKDADFICGDTNILSVNKIRNSKTYLNFVKNVFLNRQNIEICKNCTEGLKNE